MSVYVCLLIVKGIKYTKTSVALVLQLVQWILGFLVWQWG